MTNPKTALGPWHRRGLYGAVALTWLSGVLWLIDKHFRQVPMDFGVQAPPTQAIWLALHGAAAMIILVLLGSLLPDHVRLGWKRKERTPSGSFALGVCALLAVSGWGLYYIGDQTLRHGTSIFHWVLGIFSPAIIALHAHQMPRTKTSRPAFPDPFDPKR